MGELDIEYVEQDSSLPAHVSLQQGADRKQLEGNTILRGTAGMITSFDEGLKDELSLHVKR